MAEDSSSSQVHVPMFKGENYNLWSLKMRTMFRFKGFWQIVEHGFSEEGEEEVVEALRMKDASALYLIQQGVEESILIRIAEALTAQQAWEILRTEYQGNNKILYIKLYAVREEMEALKIKPGERVQEFITRVLDLVYQIRVLGEKFPEQDVVAKILRSFTQSYKHVVSSIIEAKDLSMLTVEKLGGSLKRHESILLLSEVHEEQTALPAFHNSSEESFKSEGRGRAHGSNAGHFRG